MESKKKKISNYFLKCSLIQQDIHELKKCSSQTKNVSEFQKLFPNLKKCSPMQNKLVDEFQKTCTQFQKIFLNSKKIHKFVKKLMFRKCPQLENYGEIFFKSVNKFLNSENVRPICKKYFLI